MILLLNVYIDMFLMFNIFDKNTLYTLYLKIYIKYSFPSHYTSDTKNKLYDYNVLEAIVR